MRTNMYKLAVAIGIAVGMIMINVSAMMLLDLLSKWTGVNMWLFVAPILFAYLIWFVYNNLKSED